MIRKVVATLLFLISFLTCDLWFTPYGRAQIEPSYIYKGRTIRIVVGTTPGGLYDRWARLLARRMPEHILGHPEMIVQNMAGASSLIATNYVYKVAKPDGLTVVMPLGNIYLEQLVGRKEVEFDVLKFHWIGTQEKSHTVLYIRADAPYTSIGDIINAKEPPKCGSTGTASADYVFSRILEEAVGAKISTVVGYPGGSEVDLAVERGEVVCRGQTIAAHFSREATITWHKKGFIRHLAQSGRKRDSRLPDTPTIYELMDSYKTSEVKRRVADVILTAGEFGRPMLVTPGTPPERVKVLREAYSKAMKDPELLAEAKKRRMDVEPSSGEELQALAKQVMDQPREVVERVQKILGK
ncbi:MAG: hypothetical protein HYY81_07710 [Deltaproteobacteria bacterium]|nr:hypothetical protein [Deltaproteobacteria bacterium]